MNPLGILLVDDDREWAEDFCDNLQKALPGQVARMGWDSVEIRHAVDQEDADRAVQEKTAAGYDLVLLDLWYPESPRTPLRKEFEQESQGMQWLPRLRQLQPNAAIIIITAYPYESQLKDVVMAVRGDLADEFVPKVATLEESAGRIALALQHSRRKRRLRILETELGRLMAKRVPRAFLEDVLDLLDRNNRAPLSDIARRIETGDPSAIARAPDEIRTIYSSIRRSFLRMGDVFGAGKEQATRIDVAKLVRDASALYESRLARVGATITLRLEQGDIEITTYSDDLRIALHEILCNAVCSVSTSAKPEGEREIRCGLRRHGNEVSISVIDNGNGFVPEVIDRMFEPGVSTHEDDSHRGLGLYIAKRMVDGLGGSIEARNKPGKGAEVVLTIPDLVKP